MTNVLYLSVFTEGIKDLALNHLTSLKKVGITNTLSLCPTQSVVDELNALGFRSERLKIQDEVAKEFSFADGDFNTFSYVRYEVASRLLQDYDCVWYMDVDTVVLSNPFSGYIQSKLDGADIFFQDDIAMPCTGCMLVKNTQRAKDFLQFMWESRNSETNDQMHLQMKCVKQELPGVVIYLLSIYDFVPGCFIFPSNFLVPLNDFIQSIRDRFIGQVKDSAPPIPTFVHANFMVGCDTKRQALRAAGLWFI